MKIKPLIITLGDPNSIGPEIVINALRTKPHSKFLLVGSRDSLLKLGAEEYLDFLVEVGPVDFKVEWGKECKEAGVVAYEALKKSVDLIRQGVGSAILNAPVSKKAIELSVPGFVGHTGFYENLLGDGNEAIMSFFGQKFSLALFTHHIPLADVSKYVLDADLQSWLKRCFKLFEKQIKKNIKMSVLGLNPHAGEQGLLSHGEDEKIAEAVSNLRQSGYAIDGPLSADTFFQNRNLLGDRHCLVVSMQHDQGLIPFKMAHFGNGVATTLGLSCARFTVDHGTAFDLAGKGLADSSSMIHSLKLALQSLDEV